MTREEEALNIWEHSKGVIEVLTSYQMGAWLHRRDKRVIGKILDKIRAEIMAIGNWRFEYEIPNSDMREVLKIIDKHTSGGDTE